MSYAIDIQQYFPAINEALKIVLDGAAICAAGFAAWFLKTHAPSWLSADNQAKMAKVIDNGLNKAVAYALNTVESHEKDVKVTTDSKIVQIGVNYALKHLGVTLAEAGKSPQDIAEMIVARLPVAPTDKDLVGVTIPTPAKVEVQPLPAPAQ